MYSPQQAIADCRQSLEEQIIEINKQIKVDKALLSAMDDFADLHGDYAIAELEIFKAYGNLVRAIKVNSKDVKQLIKKQGKK